MTLLDTFLLSFGTEGLGEIAKEIKDTENKITSLEKKEEELNKTIKEGKDNTVQAKIELVKVKNELKETREHLDKTKNSTGGLLIQFKNLATVAAKIGATFIAVKKAVDLASDFALQGEALANLSESAQTDIDTFQNLSNAIVHYGGSVEEASTLMEKFKTNLKDIQKGGNGGGLKEVAVKYHIDTNTVDVDEFLQNVAKKMETLSENKKLELSNQLGLDSATFKLVSGGLDNYLKQLEQINKYKVFTKEDVERSKEFEMALRDIRMGSAAIGANLAQLLLPVMVKVAKAVKNVVDFFVEHGAFIKAVIIAIGAVLTAIAIPAIVKMGLALWSALAPVLPVILGVTAAIVAFGLVAEDIYKWIHGEPSIAELIFGDFKTFVDNFIKGLENIKTAFKTSFVEGIKVLCTSLFDFIKTSWDNLWNNILSKIPAVEKTVNFITKKVNKSETTPDGSHASGLDYVPYDGYIAELHKGERVQTAQEAADWRANLQTAQSVLNFADNHPLNAVPSGAFSNAYNNSVNNNNTTAQNINISGITINTQATDAKGIANDLADYIKQAVISLDDGMLA